MKRKEAESKTMIGQATKTSWNGGMTGISQFSFSMHDEAKAKELVKTLLSIGLATEIEKMDSGVVKSFLKNKSVTTQPGMVRVVGVTSDQKVL